jgi:hypothetical protein
MPPPSPSQQQPQTTPYPAQRGPLPPFSSGRELPGLGSTPRHGAGMSISSILGTDSPSSQSAATAQHSPTATTQSPSSISMQPPSPRRGQNVGSRIDYGQNWRRPQTPEKHPLPGALRASDNAPYSASSSPRQFPGSRGSPEYNRSGPPLLQHLYQSSAAQGTRPYQPSPNDPHEREQARQSEERVPPRPNSQPAAFALPRDTGLRDAMAALAARPPIYGSSPFDHRTGPDEQRHPASTGYGERNGVPVTSREHRPITAEPPSHSAYSPPHDQRSQASRDTSRDESGRDNLARREEYNAPFRAGFRQYYQPPGGGHGPEAPRSHPQGMDPFRRPNEGPGNPLFSGDYNRAQDRPPISQPYDPHNQDRRTSEPQPHGVDMQYSRSMSDSHSQPLMMQRSRSSLGIGPEGKRGRASPLPQAVQGAQAQLVGPGADPNIKSEFGRIFQGLGSGIGGHLTGISTPPRGSPIPRRHAPDVEPIVLSDGDGAKMTRINSKGPKKGRRVKEEEGRLDGESIDGRGTPLGSGARGSKRTKVSHHHHLHQHNHA